MKVVLPTIAARKGEFKAVSPSSRYDIRISIAKTVRNDVTRMTNEASRALVRMVLESFKHEKTMR